MLVITGVAVLLLVIEEAVPYLRGEVVLVVDRESSRGVNVSLQCRVSRYTPLSLMHASSAPPPKCMGRIWNEAVTTAVITNMTSVL